MRRLMLVCLMIPMLILSFAFAETPSDRLGFTLLEQMYSDGQNLVFSPVSLSFSLGMAAEGAAGQTREEIQRLTSLHSEDAAAMITGFSVKGIKIANVAFAAEDLPILNDWRNKVIGHTPERSSPSTVRRTSIPGFGKRRMDCWNTHLEIFQKTRSWCC